MYHQKYMYFVSKQSFKWLPKWNQLYIVGDTVLNWYVCALYTTYCWNKLSQQQNQYWKLIWYWGGKCYVNSHIWIKYHHQIMWAFTHKNRIRTEQEHKTQQFVQYYLENAAWNLYVFTYLFKVIHDWEGSNENVSIFILLFLFLYTSYETKRYLHQINKEGEFFLEFSIDKFVCSLYCTCIVHVQGLKCSFG